MTCSRGKTRAMLEQVIQMLGPTSDILLVSASRQQTEFWYESLISSPDFKRLLATQPMIRLEKTDETLRLIWPSTPSSTSASSKKRKNRRT